MCMCLICGYLKHVYGPFDLIETPEEIGVLEFKFVKSFFINDVFVTIGKLIELLNCI